ncbi:MAG: hypothetical protein CXT67_03460 [Methanobacteriota archaeon]|jgi:ELWxxDGT repeat protein|nr:MAG: hypothetical protein CXT67_03460 [Euryarchaeota archaeon]HIG20203.1 hypothetical protein [Candidatus Poseidoniales archaeon]
MRKEAIATTLVLLMLVAIGGYMITSKDETDSESPEEHPGNNQIGDEWEVYYVQSDDDLPACESSILGRLYYVESTSGFETCTGSGWVFVDLTGPSGTDGTNGTNGQGGADGIDGINGTNGIEGTNGTNGQDGADGIDGSNGNNGTNGANGQDGADGIDGTNGQNGADGTNGTNAHSALAVTSSEPSGTNCANGGIKIEVGVDDDDDGVLDASEIDSTQYVCNGDDGQDGTNGSSSSNTLLTSISLPTASLGCTSGGRVIKQGLDNGDDGGTAQNGVLEAGEVDYSTTYCSKFVISRVTDIANGGSSWPNQLTVMGSRLYFEAEDQITGYELWAHETTNGSTWQVADIWPGDRLSSGEANSITVMGTRLYFEANDNISGYELWAHETTNGSTWQVADINSGSGYGNPAYLTAMGTRLYFKASNGSGPGIWAHETTNASTWFVCWGGDGLTAVGSRLFFERDSFGSGQELWAYETNNESTWQVADIWSGSSSGEANYIIAMGTTQIFFQATDGSTGKELWTHEINGPTYQVADIYSGSNPAYPNGYHSYPQQFAVMGTRLYFEANDNISGYEMWAYETVNGSTWQVLDIGAGSISGNADDITVLGTRLYFEAVSGNWVGSNRELWVYETENNSAWQVAEFNGVSSGYANYITAMDTKIFYSATDYQNGMGWELYMMEIEHSIIYN